MLYCKYNTYEMSVAIKGERVRVHDADADADYYIYIYINIYMYQCLLHDASHMIHVYALSITVYV